MLTIGDRIRYFRKVRAITQAKLAESSGIHPVTIRKYETNKMTPQPPQILKIAVALDVNYGAISGTNDFHPRLSTVGDLMGLLMWLHKTRFLTMDGERGEDNILKRETVLFYPDDHFIRFFYPDGSINYKNPIGFPFRFDLLTDKMVGKLLNWEAEYYIFERDYAKLIYSIDSREKKRYINEELKLEKMELNLQESRRFLSEDPREITLDDLLFGDDPRFERKIGDYRRRSF